MAGNTRLSLTISAFALFAAVSCTTSTDGGTNTNPYGLDCLDGDSDGICEVSDCNDADPAIRPGAEEIVGDEIDSDCDKKEICYTNVDQDGVRTDETVESRDADCVDPGEAAASVPTGDCDDGNSDVFPSAVEVASDGVDSNCDGSELCYVDVDQDGHRSTEGIESPSLTCDPSYGFVDPELPEDCNDGNPELKFGYSANLVADFNKDLNSSPVGYQYSVGLGPENELVNLPAKNVEFSSGAWDPGPAPAMWGVEDNALPFIGLNGASDAQSLLDARVPIDFTWPAGAVVMAPSHISKVGATYVAPVDGTATLHASFTHLSTGGDGVEWSVQVGSNVIRSGMLQTTTDGQNASSGSIDIDTLVVGGDAISAVVNPRGPGKDGCLSDNACFDQVAVEFTVEVCSSSNEPVEDPVEFLGSFLINDGPYWGTNPATLSCVEACADIFGGTSLDYHCSTSPSFLNYSSFVSGWGDGTFCNNPVPEYYKKNATYNCGSFGCAYSAYVQDHCYNGEKNYCWN